MRTATSLDSTPIGTLNLDSQSPGRYVPLGLTILRLVLAPLILYSAWKGHGPWPYSIILTLGLLSDIFDGIIARRLGVATANLRRLDSNVDTVFFGSAFVALWLAHAEVIRAHAFGIGSILILKMIRSSFELMKFGRRSSYHMWSAKLWGLAIFAAFIATMFEGPDFLFQAAIWIGLVTNLEGLVASIVLREWAHDVPSLWHARWR